MSRLPLIALLAAATLAASVSAGPKPVPPGDSAAAAVDIPSLAGLIKNPESELRGVVERYDTDSSALARRWDVDYSPARRERFRSFYQGWRSRLAEIDFDRLSQEGKIDYLLLDGDLRYDLLQLDRDAGLYDEMASLVSFAPIVVELQESRRRLDVVDGAKSATRVNELAATVEKQRQALDAATRDGKGKRPSAVVGARAAAAVESLRGTLGGWYRSYAGYDPLFTWWVADPFKKADAALYAYSTLLKERVGVRTGQDEPIIGEPIGEKGLEADLAHEMIPYTPRELIAVAEREFAWCEAEMKKASREMGYGDDWKAALEKVKTKHVDPGQQPELIRKLAVEAIDFVEKRELVTVPALAKEIWRVEMMSPERQKVSPFFTGGEVISVSFPTEAMSHEDKLMSLRGNNIHFSHATVQHEVIPGHHLQQFMYQRYNSHRRAFYTPFWIEGWALYWEMLLWDQEFSKTPEDRIGMLFWRMHRAARIIFSLNFHLGKMTPQEAIDFLVNRVGHERANATGEVRRSFNGSYPPLYQAGYMLGGLQLRALHHDLVDSGKMTNRQFHDTILQGGIMPIEMVRARLADVPLTREYTPNWRFTATK